MILDSGTRREFAGGAVRDIQDGKGRCDLLPLEIVARIVSDNEGNDGVLDCISDYQKTGNTERLYSAISSFSTATRQDISTMVLELSKHFEEGAKKYGEGNWQKGLPESCYIDSAVRHYLKWLRGDKDESHDRAFVWNIVCLIWTHNNITNKGEKNAED